MNLYAFAVCLLASLQIISAKIYTVQPYTGVYHAGANTKFPLTFGATGSPITADDYSAAVGVRAASESYPGNNALGHFVYNIDLFATGHYQSLPGNFTIQVPLSSSQLYAGAGNYVLTVEVTSAYGISYFTQLRSFNITIAATV